MKAPFPYIFPKNFLVCDRICQNHSVSWRKRRFLWSCYSVRKVGKKRKLFDIILSEDYKKVQSVFSNRINHERWGLLMKMPVLIKTTARFFPGNESEATTATPFIRKGRNHGPPVLWPFQGQRVSLQSHLQEGLRSIPVPYRNFGKSKGGILNKIDFLIRGQRGCWGPERLPSRRNKLPCLWAWKRGRTERKWLHCYLGLGSFGILTDWVIYLFKDYPKV